MPFQTAMTRPTPHDDDALQSVLQPAVRRRRRWGLATAWCAGAAATLFVLGLLPSFALSALGELPQRGRPYGWLTDRLLQVAGHGLLMLAVLAALAAVISGIAWSAARKHPRPPGG